MWKVKGMKTGTWLIDSHGQVKTYSIIFEQTSQCQGQFKNEIDAFLRIAFFFHLTGLVAGVCDN